MTPQQAKIIAAWEDLHPNFYVAPSRHHSPTPGDPWRFLVQQRDNDLLIGAVSREKALITTRGAMIPENEGLVSQLRDCLMTGRMPRPLARIGTATPLRSPEGTLTVHPSDMPEAEEEEKPGRAAPWKVTPLQNRILDAWESLHAEFQVLADESHVPVNFAPWKYLVRRKADETVVAKVTKFTQEVLDPTLNRDVEKLRSCLKNGTLPKAPWVPPVRRRDPLTGQILPMLSPATTHTERRDEPKRKLLPTGTLFSDVLPPPWPTMGQRAKLEGESARFWKYGAHPEDYDEFEDRKAPKLKPGSKEYAKARKLVKDALAKLDSCTREELTLCARLASQMGDKESAHTLAVKATMTRPATGKAAGFD